MGSEAIARFYDSASEAASASASTRRGRSEAGRGRGRLRGGGDTNTNTAALSDATRAVHGALKLAAVRAATRGRATRRALDLCCGRMGDMHRWARLGVAAVVGVDASRQSLDDAADRARARAAGKSPHVDLVVGDASAPRIASAIEGFEGGFDVATVMFAVQYFPCAASRGAEAPAGGDVGGPSLEGLLDNAAAALRPGGALVVVAPCGERVADLIAGRDRARTAVAEVVARRSAHDGALRRVCFSVSGTIVDRGSEEWLVPVGELVRLARERGLEPLDDAAWSEADAEGEKVWTRDAARDPPGVARPDAVEAARRGADAELVGTTFAAAFVRVETKM